MRQEHDRSIRRSCGAVEDLDTVDLGRVVGHRRQPHRHGGPPGAGGCDSVRTQVLRRECVVERVSLDGVELGVGEPGGWCRLVELAWQARGAGRRVVGVDRHWDAAAQQLRDWMGGEVGEGARLDVAGETDFERNPPVHQQLQHGRVLDRAHAVADALGVEQLDGLTHTRRSRRLARVDGGSPAGRAPAAEVVGEQHE